MFKLRSGPRPDLTIFFATDVHGSNLCFKKLLAARDFYRADVVVLGGDLTGKMMVPVVAADGAWEARYAASTVRLEGESAVSEFEKSVSDAGYYPFRTTRESLQAEDPAWEAGVFRQQVVDRLEAWDRMGAKAAPIYVAPGNDDEMYVDDVLAASNSFVNVQGVEVELPGGYRMYSTGWSNPTPWRTPREMTEPELLAHLEGLIGGVGDPGHAIFNFHVPPVDSGLDTCYEVNEKLEVVTELGQPKLIGAGSASVRAIIERMQPVASLHGHIHESRGMARIGRTMAFNPGSEYSEGVLRGVLVSLRGDRIERHQFTSG